jgi:DNA-binding MurR/RpiR family transcriptional regulator
LSKEVYGQEDQGISQIICGDIENIQRTLKNLDVENFLIMVRYLLKARRVYIVANRSAGALGVFLHYYLNMILDHVKMLDSIERNADRLHDLGEKDFVLGTSFSRYTKSTSMSSVLQKKRKLKPQH